MKLKILFTATILLFICILSSAQNQTRTITGTVKDEHGEPLIGACIAIKGTTIGTCTDFDGKYSITFSTSLDNGIMVFTYVGFESLEIPISQSNIVDVTMKEVSVQLSEVVIIAYGVQKKESLTGAMSTVRSETIGKNSKKKSTTWKRSGMPENSIRLEVGDGANDYLPLQAAQMAVQLDGFRVRVLMDCFFFNDKKDGLEGTFKLRLPTNATPYYFAFGETEYIDEEGDFDEDKYEELIDDESRAIKPYGKKIPYAEYTPNNFKLSPEDIEDMDSREWDDVKEARIVSKQKAARAYESTVGARIDPALMEWAGADMFSCRVFPLSRGKLHRIVIGYDLNMTEALDFREYILAIPTAAKEFKLDAEIHASQNMMPEVSPAVESKIEGNRLYFSLKNPKKKEYTIHYNTVSPVILYGKDDNDNDYFAANYRINLPEVKQENLPTDAVFVFDVSLSSQPDKFNVWLKLMEEILTKNKDVIKRFSVVCFNIESFWWNNYYLKNNYYNFNAFLEYANTLALEGATDLASVLKEASAPAWLKKNAPKHIFLMSDADINWGESNMFALKALIGEGDRVHTYKTGLSGTNNAVLDYLSKETNGFSFTVTGEEEAVLTAKSFRYRPWLIENIEVKGVEDFLISGSPSQLYNGQKLIFTGRNKPEGTINIQVNNGIESKKITLNADEKIESALANRVYGQIALAQLEGYGFQTEEATESYATYFRVPNATMSFLMLESESDYDRFGIDDYDARSFIEENTVADVIKELLEKGLGVPLGESKTDFIAWLKRLKNDRDLGFKPDSIFNLYINNLPNDVFNVELRPYDYRIRSAEQQSEDEKEMIANENLRYDDVLLLADKRYKKKRKADALKLLSSVVERNAGDFIALRDIALKAIEWGFGDQAYYMMRRIIINRQAEAVAYLTASDALASSGNIDMALIYYYICMNADWDSDYGSFKEIAALQCMRFIDKLKGGDSLSHMAATIKFISHLENLVEKHLKEEDLLVKEADVVIIINWNTNNTDVDLHVMEPTDEECYYGNRSTKIGGQLTIDVTDGYGPEMYVLKNAVNGKYNVSLKYFADDETKTSSKSKVYLDFYRNWGHPEEKHTRKVIVLGNRKDMESVLQFTVNKIIE